MVGFNLPEGLCFQQRRCVFLIHRPTGGGSNGWPTNKDKHNNARAVFAADAGISLTQLEAGIDGGDMGPMLERVWPWIYGKSLVPPF